MSTAARAQAEAASGREAERWLLAGITGMVLFLFTEAMLFAGLLSAFTVFRTGAAVWPPPGQPRLPVAATMVNTLILLASGFTMIRAVRETRRGGTGTARWLALTVFLGAAFVAIQGYEWARLLRFGFSARSGTYGATFYTIVGVHAVHVLAALIVIVVSWRRAARGFYTSARHGGLILAAMFWTFVVAVWPVLYVLLYEPWKAW